MHRVEKKIRIHTSKRKAKETIHFYFSMTTRHHIHCRWYSQAANRKRAPVLNQHVRND